MHTDAAIRNRAPRVVVSASIALGLLTAALAQPAAAANLGSFSQPFTEPKIGALATDANCVPIGGTSDAGFDNEPRVSCKPAAVSVNVLPTSGIMYFDAFEGTENLKYSFGFEYGYNAVNDQSRFLRIGDGATGQGSTWTVPSPADGGANPNGDPAPEHLLPAPLTVDETYNDGALFCSDNVFLPDGRVLANGGTNYYLEPGIKNGNAGYGLTEEEGIRQSRIYDPRTNTWAQTGSMHYGRWYPSSVELANGDIFTVGGVTKLVKPVYSGHPQDSMTNVQQTETYRTLKGDWVLNPPSANHSFPLYPRLHLLPNGRVYYDAGGQPSSIFGQSYDEPTWGVSSVYDPKTKTWHNLGIPGLTDLTAGKTLDVQSAINDAGSALAHGGIPGGGASATLPGFRGSTFSIELPLTPDSRGRYTRASFLTAGGSISPPGPGSYLTTTDSRITTIRTAGNRESSSTRPTGDLNAPRWFTSAVLLPNGQVVAFNGSDRDETVTPGLEIAQRQAELFDPATKKWTPLALSHRERTYHNTAALLPDGRVLVSGHAPLPTMFGKPSTLPGGVTASNERDPSLEIFSPPYLTWGPRPKIRRAPQAVAYGRRYTVTTDTDVSRVASVVLVSNPAVTHLIDANQRQIVLPVVARKGRTLTVQAPPSANVAPPGPYMIFVNKRTGKGLLPSKSVQAFVGLAPLERQAHGQSTRP
jgi:Domain of unknown function (DUF1929)